VPKQCPLCGAEVKADYRLDGRKLRGWRCTQDPSHYWYAAVGADAALAAGESLGQESSG